MTIDMPTVRRYLNALTRLESHPTFGSFARRTLREMLEPGITPTDYMTPVITLPETKLTPEERAWRKAAQSASCLA